MRVIWAEFLTFTNRQIIGSSCSGRGEIGAIPSPLPKQPPISARSPVPWRQTRHSSSDEKRLVPNARSAGGSGEALRKQSSKQSPTTGCPNSFSLRGRHPAAQGARPRKVERHGHRSGLTLKMRHGHLRLHDRLGSALLMPGIRCFRDA